MTGLIVGLSSHKKDTSLDIDRAKRYYALLPLPTFCTKNIRDDETEMRK